MVVLHIIFKLVEKEACGNPDLALPNRYLWGYANSKVFEMVHNVLYLPVESVGVERSVD